ncbi:MAG: DUF4093 domain-containing protein [Eubacteriales bacterium]|nr:DUF4093 domain-containing protein [Eubacteriales bacterium]
MIKRLKISLPIIVEGRYDKHRLSSLLDARIITTDGFGIFREEEKRAFIRRLAARGGIIVMTDSDGAGLIIRNYLKSVLPAGSIRHVYIPQVQGRERRKKTGSKEGLIGVEGIDADTLLRLLEPYAEGCGTDPHCTITKSDFYADGMSGRPDSARRRRAFASIAGLPANLSANALLEAINMLGLDREYRLFINENAENAE